MSEKTVLITGASSGIGQACARYLAARGYHVLGTSRRPQVGSEPFEMIQMDVTDDESVRRGVQQVLEKAGRIDAVVNNAGWGFGGSVEDTSLQEAHELFEANFFGALRVCHAVLPAMRARHSGCIVNISSIGGRIGLPYQPMYSATKFAVEGLSEALRIEVRQFGIHVALVEPGDTRTGFTDNRRRTLACAGSAYAAKCDSALGVAEHDERAGPGPEGVARTVERILRSRSPRLRYRVASVLQQAAVVAKNVLPGGMFEWVMRMYYRQ